MISPYYGTETSFQLNMTTSSDMLVFSNIFASMQDIKNEN